MNKTTIQEQLTWLITTNINYKKQLRESIKITTYAPPWQSGKRAQQKRSRVRRIRRGNCAPHPLPIHTMSLCIWSIQMKSGTNGLCAPISLNVKNNWIQPIKTFRFHYLPLPEARATKSMLIQHSNKAIALNQCNSRSQEPSWRRTDCSDFP